jgi:hypothetical protein
MYRIEDVHIRRSIAIQQTQLTVPNIKTPSMGVLRLTSLSLSFSFSSFLDPALPLGLLFSFLTLVEVDEAVLQLIPEVVEEFRLDFFFEFCFFFRLPPSLMMGVVGIGFVEVDIGFF